MATTITTKKLAKYFYNIAEVLRGIDILKISLTQEENFHPMGIFRYISSPEFENQRYIDAPSLLQFLRKNDFVSNTIDQCIEFIKVNSDSRCSSLLYKDFEKFISPRIDSLYLETVLDPEKSERIPTDKIQFLTASLISRYLDSCHLLIDGKEDLSRSKYFQPKEIFQKIDTKE